MDIEKIEQNLYKIKYTPDDCGRYTIDALYDGKQLPQSPIYVQSFSTGNVSYKPMHVYSKIRTLILIFFLKIKTTIIACYISLSSAILLTQ